jgi:hypothetical protein
MIRTTLIGAIVLVLTLSWSMECAEGVAVNQDGFYVIVTKKKNYAPVEKTGQTASYLAGDDGYFQKGIAWPNPRFTDNGDGTVTDRLTGLIWLKNANCTCFYNGDITGQNERDWSGALTAANLLASGYCGLTDGSSVGDWRLPNVRELQSLIHYGFYVPALPNTSGTGQWSEGNPFAGVQSSQSSYYYSSTLAPMASHPWSVCFYYGNVVNSEGGSLNVWCVRGGN